jgi:hypothetical protein
LASGALDESRGTNGRAIDPFWFQVDPFWFQVDPFWFQVDPFWFQVATFRLGLCLGMVGPGGVESVCLGG